MNCSETGCGREAATRGMCSMHYKRARNNGTLPRINKMRGGAACERSGCGSAVFAGGLCLRHYRLSRGEYAGAAPLERKSKPLAEMSAAGRREARRSMIRAKEKARPARGWPMPPEKASAAIASSFATVEPFFLAVDELRMLPRQEPKRRGTEGGYLYAANKRKHGRLARVNPERDEPEEEREERKKGCKNLEKRERERRRERARLQELQEAV